jgi:outer membrane receptor protein involved in Fe transport
MFAQGNKLTGVVTDASSGEKLMGANVFISALGTGSVTNAEGVFTIANVRGGTFEVTVSYVGYLSLTKNININGETKINFALEPSSVLLNETVVKSTKAVLRETPIAFSQVSGKDIEMKLASRDLPMALAQTPSVYASQYGGGAGDANMVIRGFGQSNIAIMINGVPVNDMEGKTVYWSNWAGIGDVAADIQIQRGIGASPYSINAVGALVNVTTAGIGTQEEYVKVKSEYGSDNLGSLSIALHQKLPNNFAITALASRKTWDGYAVGTYFQEWTYYLAFGRTFGNHSLELQAVGSPQEHGQRPTRLTEATWQLRDPDQNFTFNANVGRLHGGNYNDAINKYHKPAFNLNWNWQINQSSNLSTIAYYSFGRGWGSGLLGAAAPVIANGLPYAGYKDYDAVWNKNASNIDAVYSTAAYGAAGLHRSLTVNRVNYNSHDWMGLLSTFKTKLTPELNLTAGIDGRYYIGYHYQEIRDLLGGDYYVDKYVNGTGGNINNPLQIAHIGDNVGYSYEGHVRQLGGFGQLEYKSGQISTFVNLSLGTSGDQRLDKFNYLSSNPARLTDWVNFTAYTGKTGINFNINTENSVFANVGYFSTPPTLSNIFVGFNSVTANNLYQNLTNEKVFDIELGYQYATPIVVVKLDAFSTNWKDRAFTTSATNPVTTAITYANVVGSAQLHQGIELEATWKVIHGLEAKASGSLINARYLNDVNARVSDENGTLLTTVYSYVNGLKVPSFPQTSLALEFTYNLQLGYGTDIYINPVYRFNGDQYSYFSPDTRKVATDKAQSWKLPDYGMIDLNVGVSYLMTNFFVKKITLDFHVFNLLDYDYYMVDGTDGVGHAESTATIWYGRPRWMNLNLGFNF